uniref:C-type lectin domain-containing protein n=1 Tax=Panagrolaimus sp. ES5 TaxID=591445 RepID=A0AC34FYG5_9BILA
MTPLMTEKMTISSATYQSTYAPTLPLTSSKTKSSSTIAVTSTTLFPSTSSSTISQTPTTSASFPSTNSPSSTKNCSNGWNYFEKTDSCYFLLFNEARTWNESENQCNSYGAHLTSIHSEEESIFVNRTLSDFFGTSPYRCTEIWIGLYSNDNKTTWKWTDNSPLGDYLPWWPGYPASFYGNCAVLGDFCPRRVLGNLFCDVKRYSVCKKAA